MERSESSFGGLLLDATGDGSADDVMVFNNGQNEVLVVCGDLIIVYNKGFILKGLLPYVIARLFF